MYGEKKTSCPSINKIWQPNLSSLQLQKYIELLFCKLLQSWFKFTFQDELDSRRSTIESDCLEGNWLKKRKREFEAIISRWHIEGKAIYCHQGVSLYNAGAFFQLCYLLFFFILNSKRTGKHLSAQRYLVFGYCFVTWFANSNADSSWWKSAEGLIGDAINELGAPVHYVSSAVTPPRNFAGCVAQQKKKWKKERLMWTNWQVSIGKINEKERLVNEKCYFYCFDVPPST